MNAKRDLPHYAGGDRIAGKYQLLRPLGVGGMGVVWVAHNLVLDIHVAVKLIRRHLAGALATERLLREARSAARIAHPGIVRVFDFGTTVHGDPFIVMELLEGETLRDLLDREQRLTPLRAAATLLPIAGALASLEGTGIVHRDMKPDNVILVRTDEDHVVPKLVDFGVAIVPGMERVTQGGLIVGTPDYLAPEQAAGEDIDHRADVWAFSVVLFEALTGQRPFVAEAVPDLLNAILLSPTPSIQDLGVHDPELDAIVARGLEKLRDRRWSSMRSLAAALAAWARAHGLTEDITGAAVRDRLSDSSALPPASEPAHATPAPIGDALALLGARAGRTNRAHAEPPSVAGLQVVADPEIADDRQPAALHQPAPALRHDDLPITVESAATRARRVEAEASRAPDLARPAPPEPPARSPRAPLVSSPPKPTEEPSPPSAPSASPEPRRNRSRAGLLVAVLALALAALALVAARLGSGPRTASGPLPGAAAPSSSLPASSLLPGPSSPASTEPSPSLSSTSTGAPAVPGSPRAPAITTTSTSNASPPTSSTAPSSASTSAIPAASASTSARPAATAPDTRTDPGRIDDLKDPYKPLKDPF